MSLLSKGIARQKLSFLTKKQASNISGFPPSAIPMNLSGALHSPLVHCCPDTHRTTGKAKLLWLFLSFFLLLFKEG